MRHLLLLLALAVGLAIPVAALGEGSPSPSAVAACQAEAASLGTAAFTAKYGPTEPFGHCYAAHATATPTTATTTTDDPAAAACKAEYLQLGPTAFIAKYGATETYGNCLAAHRKPATTTTTTKPPTTAGDDGAANSLAGTRCSALVKQLGRDAFVVQFGGKEAMGNCVKAGLAKARAAVAACRASSGSNRDAFKACLSAAVTQRR